MSLHNMTLRRIIKLLNEPIFHEPSKMSTINIGNRITIWDLDHQDKLSLHLLSTHLRLSS